MTNEQILEYSNYIYGLTKYFKNYKNKEDLYQAGCIGLIMAYNRFDSNMGAKFTTYAFPFIIGEMYKLVSNDKGIKISSNYKKLNLKIEKVRILLSQSLNRYPTNKELAQYLEVDELDIIECMRANNPIMSMDYKIDNDDKNIILSDIISDEQIDIDTLIMLKQEMNKLNKEERYILESNLNNYTQEEIAKKLGINQVQVSRKLNKIKEKIKLKVA